MKLLNYFLKIWFFKNIMKEAAATPDDYNEF